MGAALSDCDFQMTCEKCISLEGNKTIISFISTYAMIRFFALQSLPRNMNMNTS